MKQQQPAVRSAPSVVAKNIKPTHSVTKVKAAATPKSKIAGNADGRLEMIRQRAYSFYEARSYEGGHELDDWLQAEAQVDQIWGKKSRGAQSLM
jgi:hypothetical protein